MLEKIDTHQHFWRFDPIRDNWITEDMGLIRKDVLPGEVEPLMKASGISGSIAVQADQSEAENTFLLELAAANSFIKGIIGWVDMRSDDIEDSLQFYCQHKEIKGFRHILESETDRALMLTPEFKRGIAALSHYNYTYDILVRPDQLPYAIKLAELFPEQKFILDHIGKPLIREGNIEEWERDIRELALSPNVFCKVSGLATEADWNDWRYEHFLPYLDVVFDTFGVERVMFGSDWPLCLLAGGYERTTGILEQYTMRLTEAEQEMVWGANAVTVYGL